MFMWITIIILIAVCLFLVLRIKAQQTEMSEYRKSDRLKSAFIKALAREIRTPLHSVSGLAEIIAKDDLYLSKEEKKGISDQILYNAGMISTLLDEVAIYSEDGSKGHRLEDERFSPNRLCQRCINSNRSRMAEGVKMVYNQKLGDEFFVSAERHIVELVLNKLVFSACKYTQKGEILVECTCDSTRHRLSIFVENTGAMIPEDRKKFLFTWFETPDLKAEETEFDLSVAQRLAAKIGGYIRLDENYKRGTRMEFTLPVR